MVIRQTVCVFENKYSLIHECFTFGKVQVKYITKEKWLDIIYVEVKVIYINSCPRHSEATNMVLPAGCTGSGNLATPSSFATSTLQARSPTATELSISTRLSSSPSSLISGTRSYWTLVFNSSLKKPMKIHFEHTRLMICDKLEN